MQTSDVERWWSNLKPVERHSTRRDGGRAPAGVLARFVEGDAPDDAGAETSHFYEYLVNHEVYLDDGRVFHICSAHPEARARIAARHVPADFRCPRRNAACPMRTLLDLAPGRDLRLSLVRKDFPGHGGNE
jgi:hypothetical protein